MGWEKFTQSSIRNFETPVVVITSTHFYYGTVAVKMCEIREGKRVIYHIDELNRKIGFEFVTENLDHSYAVFGKKGTTTYRSTAHGIVALCPWVKSVALLSDVRERRFHLQLDRNIWAAQLCPAFEYRVLRTETKSIPSNASGIYRYTNAGVIVYIGKGNIRNRLSEIGREQWQFDNIEYSILSGEDKQYEWESYWIGRFKDSNNNTLPVYNAIAGRTS